jgi:hypothetical protein
MSYHSEHQWPAHAAVGTEAGSASTHRPSKASPDGLSRELQIGKAAEHLACADVMIQGFNAFLSDQGLPYDMLVDIDGTLLRVQVKGTLGPYTLPRGDGRGRDAYRFGLRRGIGSKGRISPRSIDVFAFVALDTRRVAYVRTSELLDARGDVVGLVEIVDDAATKRWGALTFGKCQAFPAVERDMSSKACFSCSAILPATAEFFALNKRCRGGINGICRTCSRATDTAGARVRREKRRAGL